VTNAKFTYEDVGCVLRRLDVEEDRIQISYLEFVNCIMPGNKQTNGESQFKGKTVIEEINSLIEECDIK